MVLQHKEQVDEIKLEWKRLWQERVDDKIRAEGIAIDDYSTLFIDKGTIIHATRDFKALNLKDILEQHEIENPDRYIPPDPHVGGWGKFVKNTIPRKTRSEYSSEICEQKKAKGQKKKNGCGWLHL